MGEGSGLGPARLTLVLVDLSGIVPLLERCRPYRTAF